MSTDRMWTGAGYRTGEPTWSSSSPPPSVLGTLSPPQPAAWHTSVPYLFIGLVGLLACIASSLLLLACSYWRESRYLGQGAAAAGSDVPPEAKSTTMTPAVGDQFVVIMAGDEKPSYVARRADCLRGSTDNEQRDVEKETKVVVMDDGKNT